MPKAGELDWSDLMKGKVGEPEHPLSKPVKTGTILAKGEIPRKPTDEEVRKAIMEGAPKQPTDEQLFGHLVVSEEQVKQAETKWNNCFNDFYKSVKQPVESQDNKSWGSRGPIENETLTEEEERIRQIPVNESYDE